MIFFPFRSFQFSLITPNSISLRVSIFMALLFFAITEKGLAQTPEQQISPTQSFLIVMRHGEGTHNVRNVADKDAHLTDKGKLQARTTAKKLLQQGVNKDTISYVFVSPYLRTQETAIQLASEGVIDATKIILEPRIAEPTFGALEGKPFVIPANGEDPWDLIATEKVGGESLKEVRQRVQEFYRDLQKLSSSESITNASQSDKKCGHIIVISHGTPSRELIDIATEGKERTKLETAEAKLISLPLK